MSTFLLVGCALVLTGLVVRRELGHEPGQQSEPPDPQRVEAWDEVQRQGQVLGAPGGEVTLVEFSDFQCPYCAHFYHTLDSLIADYPTRLRVVYRHFPIASIHPQARAAALASECAARQRRFDDYYHALFRNQGRLPLAPWVELAAEIGLDSLAFDTCMQAADVDGRLAEDSAMVAKLGLRGTPTVIIDGWELPGTPSSEVVREYIDAAIRLSNANSGSP